MLVAGVASTTLTGCFYFSDPTTDMQYVAADGNIATVGSVKITNVLVVSAGKGQKGSMQGLATNNGTSPAKLVVTPQGGSATTITIPALQSVRLDGKPSGDGTATVPPVQVAATPVAPGEQLPVTFATADGGSKQVSVPVVLDQDPYGSATADHPGSRTDESKPSAEGH